MSQSFQRPIKNLLVFGARFLKYIWPFWDIMQQSFKTKAEYTLIIKRTCSANLKEIRPQWGLVPERQYVKDGILFLSTIEMKTRVKTTKIKIIAMLRTWTIT